MFRAMLVCIVVCAVGCTDDEEDTYDLDTDECAQPGAQCQPESDGSTLDADEAAGAMPDDPLDPTLDDAADETEVPGTDAGEDPAAVVPATCTVTKSSPWFLLYASPGADESEKFLGGCPGEVIVGEKHEAGPSGRMKKPANHARGGRTAFVVDRNGDKLRDLLARPNGVERTAQYFRDKLAAGYDYIVIDEITAAPDWADGGSLNEKFRKVLLRVPPRTVIGYVSIDLTQYAGGDVRMKNRRYLLRALKQRGRGIALEVYLHTPQVMAGSAPHAFAVAADRLALAVKGMSNGGGINLRATTVIGTSMHSAYPQYRYLDQPAHDLSSITRQVNAIRFGTKRLRQQHGVGFYFVNKSDMAPPSAYSYTQLIDRMRAQTRRAW